MKVLMIGVSNKRHGGMWSVSENYLKDKKFCDRTNLYYIATSIDGNMVIRFFFMLYGCFRAICMLFFCKIDIVHIHMADKGSVFRKGIIAIIAKKRGCIVLIHMHAGSFMNWFNSLNDKYKKIVLNILNHSDKIIVLGEYWKKQLSSIIDFDKLYILYNGVICLDKNPYNLDARNILFMSVFKKEKGIYDLLNTIKNIDEDLPDDIKILLCGIDLEGNIEETINNYNLKERVILKGWINESEKINIYKNAMLAVLPSYFEALSMTVIEAMSYGIPMITTNISTMREILGNNVNLIKVGDIDGFGRLILELCSNPKKRIEMSNNEFERAKKKFDLEEINNKTLCLYESLINERNKCR